MLLIFGIRESEDLLGTLNYVCDVCGHQAAHQVIRRRRRFSLFFIPLFSVGTRYVDVCIWCARTREISRQQAESATRELR